MSCTADFDRQPIEPAREQVSIESEVVWHKETQSWVRQQDDPYALENFQQAYDNLVSGESKLAAVSKEFATTLKSVRQEFPSDAKKLQATHYALKVYPKTEEELRKLRSDKALDIRRIPFDYASVSDEQAADIKKSVQMLSDEQRYSVTHEAVMTSQGIRGPETYLLPVLYVVWPADRPLPVELDYEILYEVFLPQEGDRFNLGADAMQILEQEAVALSIGTGTPIEFDPIIPHIILTGMQVQHYDSFLGKYVPMSNLKVEFRLGTSTSTYYTDYNGKLPSKSVFGIGVFQPSTAVHLVFEYEEWRITDHGGIYGDGNILEEYKGTVFDLTSSGKIDVKLGSATNPQPAPDARYEVHRAVSYFYHGNNATIATPLFDGITINAITMNGVPFDGALGTFEYWMCTSLLGRNPIIRIANNNRDNQPHLIGTVLHELGHLTHFMLRGGNFKNFDRTDGLLKESYASYVGWATGEAYYMDLGWERAYPDGSADGSITHQARQNWGVNSDSYSPLFVDLVDSYNQSVGTITYADDPFEIHFFNVNLWGVYQTWEDFENHLLNYADQFFSLPEQSRLAKWLHLWHLWYENN